MANKEAEMTIEVGTVLRATKTGAIGTIVEVNDKFKTAIIEMEDGSSTNYSVSTLKDKRRWLPVDAKEEEATIEDEYVEEIMKQKKDLGIECPKIDSYEAVIIPEQETKKLSNPEKSTDKVEAGIGFDIKDFILKVAEEIGVDICESKGRFISFKVNDKMCAGLFSYSKKSATIGTRSKALEGTDIEPTSVLNHMMDYRFKFESLTLEDERRIRLILEAAADYQRSK